MTRERTAEEHAYRLTVAYLGTAYAGWQRQPGCVTVQQVLEDGLRDLTGDPVRVSGAGRTDAGVHARGQVVSVRLSRAWPESGLVHGTNRHLPRDVRVLTSEECPLAFHPQHDALAKEYRYRLIATPVLSPLDAATAVRVDPRADFDAVRAATRHLVGRHDFAVFAKTGGSHRCSHRTVFAAGWSEAGTERTLRILGDGFLRGMVRAIIGTLLEVGRGRRPPGSLESLFRSGDRAEAGPNAPAEGLVLQEVFYSQEALDVARGSIAGLW